MSSSTHTASANVVIAGASGGIGAALIRQFRDTGRATKLFALHRSTADFGPGVIPLRFDLKDEDSIRAAAETVATHGPVDIVITATGLLHAENLAPEKALRDIDPEAMIEAYRINAVGPALLAKHFLPLMRKRTRTVFAAISARVGSIGDNRLGGWASYRASKAGLNMLLKTVAIEHQRRWPESIVVALHPGTVDTRLSAPFQSRVPQDRLFAPAFAAERLIGVIDGLGAADTGRFFAWDGSPITY